MLPGMMIPYAAAAIPMGYFLCDGQAVSRTTYAALFAAIGTTYGIGDGATTFNIPDCRGRAVIGAGTGAGLTPRARGDVGGTEAGLIEHLHTLSQLGRTELQSGSGASNTFYDGYSGSPASSDNAGSGTDGMPPFAVAGWLIKY
jgi:microcystin-dependent protein